MWIGDGEGEGRVEVSLWRVQRRNVVVIVECNF